MLADGGEFRRSTLGILRDVEAEEEHVWGAGQKRTCTHPAHLRVSSLAPADRLVASPSLRADVAASSRAGSCHTRGLEPYRDKGAASSWYAVFRGPP